MKLFPRSSEIHSSSPKREPSPCVPQESPLISRRNMLKGVAGVAALAVLTALPSCSILENKKATERSFMEYVSKYRPDLYAEMKEKLEQADTIEELDQTTGSGAERGTIHEDVFADFINKRELSPSSIKDLLNDNHSTIDIASMGDLAGSINGPSNHGWYALIDQYPGYFGYKGFVCENKRYAQAQSIRSLMTLISYWHTLHGDNEIRFGHLTAAGHDSHRKGTSVDLNTYGDGVVNEGQPVAGHKLVPHYSQQRTIELGTILAKLVDEKGRPMVKLIYFGTRFSENKDIYEHVIRPDGTRVVLPWAGHDDHMHVEFYAYEDDSDYSSQVFAPQC